MGNNNQALNFLKGDFAELLAENHFKQMGFQVYRTGKEFIAPNYTNHTLLTDNKKSINNHIQNLPDILLTSRIKWENNTASNLFELSNSFVEVKYSDTKDIKQYIVDQIFKYRKYIFKEYFYRDSFKDVKKKNWDLEEKQEDFIKNFDFDNMENDRIKLPIMFYIFNILSDETNKYDIFLVKYDPEIKQYIYINAQSSLKQTSDIKCVFNSSSKKMSTLSEETKQVMYSFKKVFDKSNEDEINILNSSSQVKEEYNGFIKEFLDRIFSFIPIVEDSKENEEIPAAQNINENEEVTEKATDSQLTVIISKKHHSVLNKLLKGFMSEKYTNSKVKTFTKENKKSFEKIYDDNKDIIMQYENKWQEYYNKLNDDSENNDPSMDKFYKSSTNENSETYSIYLAAFIFTILTLEKKY